MLCVKGDKLKHKKDDRFFKVRVIKSGTFLLESEDTLNWVWLKDRDLNLFFEPVEKMEQIEREIWGGENQWKLR